MTQEPITEREQAVKWWNSLTIKEALKIISEYSGLDADGEDLDDTRVSDIQDYWVGEGKPQPIENADPNSIDTLLSQIEEQKRNDPAQILQDLQAVCERIRENAGKLDTTRMHEICDELKYTYHHVIFNTKR